MRNFVLAFIVLSGLLCSEGGLIKNIYNKVTFQDDDTQKITITPAPIKKPIHSNVGSYLKDSAENKLVKPTDSPFVVMAETRSGYEFEHIGLKCKLSRSNLVLTCNEKQCQSHNEGSYLCGVNSVCTVNIPKLKAGCIVNTRHIVNAPIRGCPEGQQMDSNGRCRTED